jgi:hypothetical protein
MFDEGFNCFLGFGFHMGFGCCGCFLAERVWQVVLLFLGSGFIRALLYTACVCRGGLRFFNKLQPYLLEKKEKEKEKKLIKEKRKGKNGNIALQMAEILMIIWWSPDKLVESKINPLKHLVVAKSLLERSASRNKRHIHSHGQSSYCGNI